MSFFPSSAKHIARAPCFPLNRWASFVTDTGTGAWRERGEQLKAHAGSLWYTDGEPIDALKAIKRQPYNNKILIKTITYMYIANQVQFFS